LSKTPRTLAVLLLALAASAAVTGGPARAAPAPAVALKPPSEKYMALREVAFSTKSEDVEVKAEPGQERAYGVIMEYWQGDAIVTVVGFASGDSSIYYSTGGGLIGGRREPLVASAAGSLVATAQVELPDVPRVTAYPTPDPGKVTIYVLTTAGLRGVQAAQGEMATAEYRLNPLYAGAQKIVSEFRAARS
jgi:hypothetical protein